FLMRHPNLVATAIGRYRIRTEDSWPNDKRRHHGTGVRRLDNSEVRPYSWPCILAPKEITTEIAAPRMARPINNIGASNPIIARVQGNEYLATRVCREVAKPKRFHRPSVRDCAAYLVPAR